MIHIENFSINGIPFVRTWSDTGYIMRDGIVYEEANDPAAMARVYVEVEGPDYTDTGDDDSNEEPNDAVSSLIEKHIRLAARYASV